MWVTFDFAKAPGHNMQKHVFLLNTRISETNYFFLLWTDVVSQHRWTSLARRGLESSACIKQLHIRYFVSQSHQHSRLQMVKFQNSWNLSVPLAFGVNSWSFWSLWSRDIRNRYRAMKSLYCTFFIRIYIYTHIYIYIMSQYIYICRCPSPPSTSIYSSFL